jgi:hypothetical protein
LVTPEVDDPFLPVEILQLSRSISADRMPVNAPMTIASFARPSATAGNSRNSCGVKIWIGLDLIFGFSSQRASVSRSRGS